MKEIAGTIFLIFIFVTVVLPIAGAILMAAAPLLPIIIPAVIFYYWMVGNDPGVPRD